MNTKHLHQIITLIFLTTSLNSLASEKSIVWEIGRKDNSPNEFALAPNSYNNFLERNFGFEDQYFLINHSNEKDNFPYVLPGPADTWGGTWPTAGWRTHEINILFGSSQTNEIYTRNGSRARNPAYSRSLPDGYTRLQLRESTSGNG